jgi:phytoene dehydrogenase-like protein
VISILCYAKYDTFDKFLDLKNKINNDYISIKQKITEQLIEAVSKVLEIPNLKKHIEVMELATPITFRNYSNNPTGAIMGWKMTPLQFILNPLSQKTPIDNLFLCGQWASPSGGLPSVAISADVVSELAMDYLKNEIT